MGRIFKYVLAMSIVRQRLDMSISKHGDWDDYTPAQVFEAVAGEFDEFREAFLVGKVVGKHGQVDELCDLAVVAIKGMRQLAKTQGGNDENK